jgi:uncharacterized RDD family membrane protein YckC
MNDSSELEYVGFWLRVLATIVDTIAIMIVTAPFAQFAYDGFFGSGFDGMMMHGTGNFTTSVLLPAVLVILFWTYKQATPGKMLIHARIVDAETGGAPSTRQNIIRYLGYFLSAFPACLGFAWIAFDARKQGWHDKLAGTVVVRPKRRGVEPVRFPRQG